MNITSPGVVPAANCAGKRVARSSALRTRYLTFMPDKVSNLSRIGRNASISAPDQGPTTVIVGVSVPSTAVTRSTMSAKSASVVFLRSATAVAKSATLPAKSATLPVSLLTSPNTVKP